MMESPRSIPRHMSPSSQDPWDWDVEDVVECLCSTHGPLSLNNPFCRLAPDFAIVLRENDVTGVTLLTEVDRDVLRSDLGVKSIGKRGAIIRTIEHLRNISPRYIDICQSNAATSFAVENRRQSGLGNAPAHGSLHDINPLTSSSSITRYLQEPMNSPVHAIQAYNGIQQATNGFHRDTTHAVASSVSQEQHTLHSGRPHTNSDSGAHNRPPLSIRNISCEFANTTTEDNKRVSGEGGFTTHKLDETRSSLRHGEIFVVDDKGRKRRKLVLTAPLAVAKPDNQPPSLVAPSHEQDSSFLVDEPVLVPKTRVNDIDHEASRPHKPEELAISDSTKLNKVNTPSLEADATGPKTFIDADGRKRVRPALIPGLATTRHDHSSRVNLFSTTSTSEGQVHNPLNPMQGKSTDNKRKELQMYLGPKALPVDTIFYGRTPMGHEVVHDDPDSTIDTFWRVKPPGFLMTQDYIVSSGQRIYVNNRLKRYFSQEQVVLQDMEGNKAVGIAPYPARIAKRFQPLSLTLFSGKASSCRAYRVDQRKWLDVNQELSSARQGSPHTNPATNPFEIVQDDSPLIQFGENESHDWDFLDKWRFQKEDAVLPLYGDSGSEDELDLETRLEIEAERKEQLEEPRDQFPRHNLRLDVVVDIVEKAIEDMIETWRVKKLPQIDYKAWRLWMKARHQQNKNVLISILDSQTVKLDTRLAKLRQGIIEEIWSSTKHLKKQCKCMETSIFDRECMKWKIQVLEMRNAPARPTKSTETKKVKRPPRQPESLKDDEEELASDESGSPSEFLDDFIDDTNLEPGVAPDQIFNETADYELDAGAEHQSTSLEPVALEVATESIVPLDDGKEQDDHKMETLLNHATKSPESSPSPAPDPGPRNTVATKRVQFSGTATVPEVIDLTQYSSGAEKNEPSTIIQDSKIKTPPIDDLDPFRRARRAQPEFRTPPSTAHIVDLESDVVKSEHDISPSMISKDDLPALSDPYAIRRLTDKQAKFLEERGDRKRLLSWLILRVSSEEYFRIFGMMRDIDIESLRLNVWEGLRALKRHARQPRRLVGVLQVDFDAIMRITGWYIAWSQCSLPSATHGVAQRVIDATLQDYRGFQDFYPFLIDRLENYEGWFLKKTKTNSKRQKLSSGSDSLGEAANDSPRKKRKYAVPESQEGVRMRHNAQQRARDRDLRRTQLQHQLKSTGDDLTKLAIINAGTSGEQDVIAINPYISSRIQPHQIEGVQFMWSELVTDHDALQGCLLAHTMGLGKSMQVITLLVTIAEASRHLNKKVRKQIPRSLRESRALVLCPQSLVENWCDEFYKWTPSPKPDVGNIGETRKVTSSLPLTERLYEIKDWSDKGGVLVIGYNSFRDLVLNRSNGKGDNKTGMLSEEQHERVRDQLLDRPNIVVADEAHAIKRQETGLAKAINQVRTKSRIALTGSPLSNNLEEYYSIVNWVAPNYLGERVEFRSKYVEPIQEGLYQDATLRDKRKGLKMLQVLKTELLPKVHRADLTVLEQRLKGKTEFLIRVPLTALQEEAYKLFVESMLLVTTSSLNGDPGQAKLWTWLAVLRLLCNHPKCFVEKLELKEDDNTGKSAKSGPRTRSPEQVADDPIDEEAEELFENSVTHYNISKTMIEQQLTLFHKHVESRHPDQHLGSISLSNKMVILFQILDFAEEAGDKLLVFSHSIPTLDYIEELLKQSKRSYRRLDGTTNMAKRQQLTKDFNSGIPNVCLISTRAGGQGLNLFGANRVVILDDTFNPMYEEQAIGRAYRIGQQKHVYVYRLTVGGTFEEAMHNQSLFKLQLATRVVDKKNPERHALKGIRQYLFMPRPLKQMDIAEFMGKDELVLDRVLANQESNPIIRSIDLTETFHKEVDEELDDEEKKEVEQQNRENELRRTDYAAYKKLVHQKSIDSTRFVGGFPRPNLSSMRNGSDPPNLARKEPLPSTPIPGSQMNVGGRTFSTPMSDGSRSLAHDSISKPAENPTVSLTGLRPELGSRIPTESPAALPPSKPQSASNIPHRSTSLGTSTASYKEQNLRRPHLPQLLPRSRLSHPQTSNVSPHGPSRGDSRLASTASPVSPSFTNPSLTDLTQLSRERTTAELYKAIYAASLIRFETLDDRAPVCWRSAEAAEGKLYRRAKSEAAYKAMVQSVIRDWGIDAASKVTGRGDRKLIPPSTDAKPDPGTSVLTTSRLDSARLKPTHDSPLGTPEPSLSPDISPDFLPDISPSDSKEGVGNVHRSSRKLSPSSVSHTPKIPPPAGPQPPGSKEGVGADADAGKSDSESGKADGCVVF